VDGSYQKMLERDIKTIEGMNAEVGKERFNGK
jgi:hypothetical protein